MIPRSTSVVSMRASADEPAQRGGRVPRICGGDPVDGAARQRLSAHGIRLSFCSDRASDTTPVIRLLRNFGNFLPNSPFKFK